ncbi:uncharacterized protein LOC120625846 [Pararge aegeria]|uniref:Jg4337 protein n=2 Tax=Pararge aegeria TaxID=116150 RepID=A0A8S4SM01_9NEOP|nr:uncharacterized protein LOC120625846 [Pararge aegeria]CAH2267730.1 jg4337 [Pararge aegeria aegeria]
MDDDISYEPMDVDLSAHSASVMDISYTSSNIDLSIVKTEPPEQDYYVKESSLDVRPETINRLILNNIQNRSNSVTSTRTVKKFQPFLLLSLTLLIISILTHQIVNFNCCDNLNIEILSHNLKTKLYGQTVAVSNIIEALESQESRKIILFYGGTGVGKTFATSIMLEKLLNHKNIYHYTMPSFLQTFSSEFMLGLLFCKSAVLVVDDLTRNDILNIKSPIKELMLKSEKLSKNITIILIYNCDVVYEEFLRKCDKAFPSELKKSLEGINAKKYFIKFESLTEEHLRYCIEAEITDRVISAKDVNKIVKNFNVSLDGCKGVHQKLQYMKIL